MEIKGTAVISAPKFVRSKFGDRFNEWINSLPEESKNILTKQIDVSAWYPLTEAVVIPMDKISDLVYNDPKKAAWELGKYSGNIALTGIYKIFIRISSPSFIVSRASNIFSTYFRPCDIKVVENFSKTLALEFHKFTETDHLIMYRIAGWIEAALEMTNCSLNKIDVTHLSIEDNPVTKITVEWV